MSVVSMISNLATPAVLSQIAGLIGADRGAVEHGLKGAVPAILASLLGKGTDTTSRSALSRALSDQDLGMLNDLSGAIGSDGGAIATRGTEMLSSILGSGQLDALASKLAGPAGLSKGAAGSLAGVAGSLVMGALGKRAREDNLDVAGLLGALQSEKGEIAEAMPADFAQAFRGSGFVASISDRLPGAGDAMPAAAALQPGGRPWWVWLGGALAVLLVLWLLSALFTGGEDVTEGTGPAMDGAADLVVDGTDIGAQVETALGTLGTTLGSITGADSAEAALPQLQDVRDTLSGLTGAVSELSPEGTNALQSLVGPQFSELQGTVESLTGDGAIAAAIGPLLAEIMELLGSFAGA